MTTASVSAVPDPDGIVRPSAAALAAFAAVCGFAPDSLLLIAALTHTSAAGGDVTRSNERLEFLGDALLSAFVAKHLLDRLPAETDEGTLSRARVAVIRKETLAAASRRLGVADVLIVGNGERRAARHTHDGLLADAFEALAGALHLEAGPAAAEHFLRESLADPLREVTTAPPAPDPKTALQMRLQAVGRGLPVYRMASESGSGHDHVFTAEVMAGDDGIVLGQGAGPNKRTAETEAARSALLAVGGTDGE